MKAHKPVDRNGKPIRVGDVVRIIGVPDISGMSPDGLAEALPAFEYLVGKYKRVQAFDENGHAEIGFVMRRADGEPCGTRCGSSLFFFMFRSVGLKLKTRDDDTRFHF